jgi:hypothetical protein
LWKRSLSLALLPRRNWAFVVKRQEDIEQELSRWAHILAEERLDLLEKIAFEMAKANGAKLPARLRVVMEARHHACTATKQNRS